MNNIEKKEKNFLLSFTAKPWFIVLMFILCYPIGIILLWIHNKLNIVVRIILTILLSLWLFLMIITGVGLKSVSFITCFSELNSQGIELNNKRKELSGIYFSKKGKYLKLNPDKTFEYYDPLLDDIYRSNEWNLLSKISIDFNDHFIFEAEVMDNGELVFDISNKLVNSMSGKKTSMKWDEFVKVDNGLKSYTKEELDKMMLNPSDYNLPFLITGWVQSNNNWNYYENGIMQKSKFLNDGISIQNYKYYVDENGNMLTNTIITDDVLGTFEIDENGHAK